MSNIVLFKGTESLPVSTSTTSKGYTKAGYTSKKDYGTLKGLKGAALTRAHLQYRIDFGMAGNVNISAMLTKGEIVAQRVVTTRDGLKVTFNRADTFGIAPTVKPEEAAAQLTDAQLLAIMASRKPAQAAA